MSSSLARIDARIAELDERIRQLSGEQARPTTTSPTEPAIQNSFNNLLTEKLQSPSPVDLHRSENDYEHLVEDAARDAGLDTNLAKAIAKAESNFNPSAVSGAGALGLMQLMPATAKGLGVTNPLDPNQNAAGGVKYLKTLMDKYQSLPNAIAAYNAGPGAVDKAGGIPNFKETQNYVKRVMTYKSQYEAGLLGKDGGEG